MRRVTYVDPLELPQARDAADAATHDASVLIEPPGTPRRFSRAAPVFHDDPDEVRLFRGFSPATVTYPPAFTAAARAATIVGNRVVLTCDDRFFTDDTVVLASLTRAQFVAQFAQTNPPNKDGRLEAGPAEDQLSLDSAGRAERHVPGTTLALISAEPANYGSFLFRVMPKLIACTQLGLDAPNVLVHPHFQSFHDLLVLAGVDPDRIVLHHPTEIYHCDQVFLPSMRDRWAFMDPEALDLFARLRSLVGTDRKRGCRIYVSRLRRANAGRSERMMLNEAELESELTARGFDIVYPEELSAADQIRTFSAAEMVVGGSGSGMFNVLFSHPGTKVVDIESEPHWMLAHSCLFASCGHPYGVFEGKVQGGPSEKHHRPFHVNIPALLARIEAFAAE